MKKILAALVMSGLMLTAGCRSFKSEGHRASFLFDDAGTRVMNGLSDKVSQDQFEDLVKRCKDNGDNTMYLFFANEGDRGGNGWIPTSFYKGLFGGEIDEDKAWRIEKKLRAARLKGMKIWAWGIADDSHHITEAALATQLQYFTDLIRLYEKYLTGVVIALEADESRTMRQRIPDLAAHLQGITKLPIGIHQKPRRYDLSGVPGVDIMFAQAGWVRSGEELKSITAEAVRKSNGKKVVMSEYDRWSNKGFGKFALEVDGCIGYGNGGSQ